MTKRFFATSYGPIKYSTQVYSVIFRILNQVMAEPVDVRVYITVKQLFRRLRSSLRDLSDRICSCDRHVTAGLLGRDQIFMESLNFSLYYMWIVDHFLANNFAPTAGGFAITLGGIRQQLLALSRIPGSPTPPPRCRSRLPARQAR